MKKFPKKGLYCFFFMYVSYGEENKKDRITANAALRLLCVKQMVTNCHRKKIRTPKCTLSTSQYMPKMEVCS